MLCIMGGLFIASHIPGESLRLPALLTMDKILHVAAYMVLGLSYSFAFPDVLWSRHSRKLSLTVLILCLLFGISDEVHQAFVPGRNADSLDLVADVTGGTIAAVLYPYLTAYIRNSSA